MSSIWSSLTSLLRWVYRPSINPVESTSVPLVPIALEANVDTARPEELSRGWEWVISTAEKDMEKILRDHQTQQSLEIRQLRKVSRAVAYRPLILQYVANLYSRLDRADTITLLDSRLDSSLRNGIFRDILAEVAEQWEDVARQILLHDLAMRELRKLPTEIPYRQLAEELVESLSENWIEEKYKKNVIGELKASGLQASNSAEATGLTTRILSDILWTLSLTLSRATSSWIVPPRALSQVETGYLVTTILNSSLDIVNLWISTSQNSSPVSGRVGQLPAQWRVESELKERAKVVDARFNDRREERKEREEGKEGKGERKGEEKKEDFKSMKAKLASLLIFKPPTKEIEGIAKISDFQTRRRILAQKLNGTI